MGAPITEQRLLKQLITAAGRRRPADVVAWCGAVQAQEYDAAKWGVGLRMHDGAVDQAIERAFDLGQILRTHVMRPTWHFVTPRDIRWLLELTGPRVHRRMSPYNQRLELDARTLRRGTRVIERALRDRHYLTRTELGDRLAQSGLVITGMRLAHLAMYAELEGVICSGPRRGSKFTYALLDERAPHARPLERDEALGELSRRFFRSHGPATVRDFVWWSGLTTADAKRGLEMNKARREAVDGRTYWAIDPDPSGPRRESSVHLLPIYDEYLVAYRDREAVPHGPASIPPVFPTSVTFQHALVVAGQVAGTWRTAGNARVVSIEANVVARLTTRQRDELANAVRRYERFRGVPIELSTC